MICCAEQSVFSIEMFTGSNLLKFLPPKFMLCSNHSDFSELLGGEISFPKFLGPPRKVMNYALHIKFHSQNLLALPPQYCPRINTN